MYTRVLAAVNEFTNSESAARFAIVLAGVCGAKLSLVFVAEAGIARDAFRHAEAALERLFMEAGEKGVEVETLTERGEPFSRIAEIVDRERVDCLFAATRREDVHRRYFVRSLGCRLMRLPCSVSLVRVVRMGRLHPRRILIPLRGRMSHIDERAGFAACMARGFEAEVTLFHAPRPLTSFFQGKIYLTAPEREKDLPGAVVPFADCLRKLGVGHDTRMAYGGVAGAITHEAARRRTDLIIMGASERGKLESLLSGNPVEEVLRETPCNLIIHRPRLKSARC